MPQAIAYTYFVPRRQRCSLLESFLHVRYQDDVDSAGAREKNTQHRIYFKTPYSPPATRFQLFPPTVQPASPAVQQYYVACFKDAIALGLNISRPLFILLRIGSSFVSAVVSILFVCQAPYVP